MTCLNVLLRGTRDHVIELLQGLVRRNVRLVLTLHASSGVCQGMLVAATDASRHCRAIHDEVNGLRAQNFLASWRLELTCSVGQLLPEGSLVMRVQLRLLGLLSLSYARYSKRVRFADV